VLHYYRGVCLRLFLWKRFAHAYSLYLYHARAQFRRFCSRHISRCNYGEKKKRTYAKLPDFPIISDDFQRFPNDFSGTISNPAAACVRILYTRPRTCVLIPNSVRPEDEFSVYMYIYIVTFAV